MAVDRFVSNSTLSDLTNLSYIVQRVCDNIRLNHAFLSTIHDAYSGHHHCHEYINAMTHSLYLKWGMEQKCVLDILDPCSDQSKLICIK